MKHRKLMIGSIAAIVLGALLWVFVGPAIVLLGISSAVPPRIRPVENVPTWDDEWSFFQAYSWLSGPPSLAEISSTYHVGLTVSLIGLCFLACGIIGIAFTFARSSVR